MKSQLIPPPELAPPSVKHLSVEKCIQLWADLVETSEAFLLAGLRNRVGPQGDVQAAFREWSARQMDDHEQRQRRFLENLSSREAARGH